MYASDYQDVLPPVDLPNHAFNEVGAEHYGRYVYCGTPTTTVPKAFPPGEVDTNFQNIGYLYPMGYVGTGAIFFCPSYNSKPTSPLGEAAYLPLLTTDSPDGDVRSSYCWNLWADPVDEFHPRLYPKQSSFEAPKCMLTEYFVPGGTTADPVVDPTEMAHDKAMVLVVAYSDFSVKAIPVTRRMMSDAVPNIDPGGPTGTDQNLGWVAGTPPPADSLGALLTDIEAAQ